MPDIYAWLIANWHIPFIAAQAAASIAVTIWVTRNMTAEECKRFPY